MHDWAVRTDAGQSRETDGVLAPGRRALTLGLVSTITLVGALGWCAIYDRYPNIVPLALSHACGTLAILYAFDDTITGGLRIGHAFLAHAS